MYQIIDGKKISQEIKDELKEKVAALKEQGKQICLAVIQVGSDPASSVYVGNKKKACAYIGIESLAYELPEETTEQELLDLVQKLNADDRVNGILVQLPLPGQIDEGKVIQTIAPEKDVDGFHEKNVGALCVGSKGYVSCTPLGIIQLLKRSGVEIAGKHCVVIGRSNIVGKPMALLLLRENGTVTVCHSRTQDLRAAHKRHHAGSRRCGTDDDRDADVQLCVVGGVAGRFWQWHRACGWLRNCTTGIVRRVHTRGTDC